MNATALVPVFSGHLAGHPAQLCNARDLHDFLEVRRDFSTWIKGRIDEYGFIEGDDYKLDSPKRGNQKSHGGDRRSRDYHLALDMAKELAMIENNDKGRQVRRYFIQCERLAQQAAAQRTDSATVAPAPRKPIRTREDLSFVRRVGERLINWYVERKPGDIWNDTLPIGQGYLNQEIAELAAHDELAAYQAVQFAITGASRFAHCGYGDGFAEAVARAVVEGLRSRRVGGEVYDPDTKPRQRLPKGPSGIALPAPMRCMSRAEREEINKKAWAETTECARECFAQRRQEMMKDKH